MTGTENDKLFNSVHGDTYFDCIGSQFSEIDLASILMPATMLKLGNWVHAGYVKPDYWKDPRGGRDRRRYSMVEIFRIALIDTLVNSVGIKPSQAVEIVDFALPFLNDVCFDRHPDREQKSKARIHVLSHIDRSTGRMKSHVTYFKPDDNSYYSEDPYLNPDAEPHGPPAGVGISLPVSELWGWMHLQCCKYLASRGRGMTDKWGRPVNAE